MPLIAGSKFHGPGQYIYRRAVNATEVCAHVKTGVKVSQNTPINPR